MRAGFLGISAGLALALVAAAEVRYYQPPPAVVVAVLPPAMSPVAPPSVPQPVVASPPAPAPAANVPDLPTVAVAARAVHAVPEDGPPPAPRPIFLQTRDGKLIDPNGAVPVAAPAAVRVPESPLSGSARAAGATSLVIAGRTVQLFGVRPADDRDRCFTAGGASAACAEVARTALAARLAGNGAVDCRVPAGQSGDPAFVCRDAAGTDLGGFLVAEGFARADTKNSYDYFGAEGVARTFHRGLWRYR